MKAKLILILLGAGIILASCTKYPPTSERLLEDLVVITKYDTTVHFNLYQKYYLSDSVYKVDSKDSGYVTGGQAAVLIDRVASNMNSLGYVRTSTMGQADLYIGISYVQNVNVSVYYPGWYWGYYPPYYWGGYYPYYPYYPAYVTSYTTGSVMMDMMDLKHPVANKYPIVWNAYIRGLMTGTHTTSEIQQAIDQSFKQTKGFPGN